MGKKKLLWDSPLYLFPNQILIALTHKTQLGESKHKLLDIIQHVLANSVLFTNDKDYFSLFWLRKALKTTHIWCTSRCKAYISFYHVSGNPNNDPRVRSGGGQRSRWVRKVTGSSQTSRGSRSTVTEVRPRGMSWDHEEALRSGKGN